MSAQEPEFPFSAVAGQTQFKLALILVAINPAIGGVLISGPRGSAKSTLARGLAEVMPVGSNGLRPPFVTLPLGATEEMLLGTLDLQQIMDKQNLEFQPGLLCKANGGVLYVDEVNLLQDHLVDLLLDVAASGVNIVERDGLSYRHAARFILLGTMNPDEGELRPQLLDRFGLCVELSNTYSIEDRINIVRLREAFELAPQTFLAAQQVKQQQLTTTIEQARYLLPAVTCSDQYRQQIAERCHAAQVDGLRADIIWYRAATAHAALNGCNHVQAQDVVAVEPLILAHRRQASSDTGGKSVQDDIPAPAYSRPPASRHLSEDSLESNAEGDWGSMATSQQKTQKTILFSLSERQPPTRHHHFIGDTSTKKYCSKNAGSVTGVSKTGTRDSSRINWLSSLIANVGRWPLQSLRFRKDKTAQAVLHMVLLDTSASTLQHQCFAKAKAVVLHIAKQAYLDRELLTILGFGNQHIELLMRKRRAEKSIKTLLDNISAGGGTPLREVLVQALCYQRQQCQHLPGLMLRTYLITDGRTTDAFQDITLLGDVSVIDIEQSAVKRGKSQQIATALSANYCSVAGLEYEFS